MHHSVTIRRLKKTDYTAIQSLLQKNSFSHLHVDWRPLSSLMDDPHLIGLLAHHPDDTQRAVACLGAMIADDNSAWLRLAALSDTAQPDVLPDLWSQLRLALKERGVLPLGVLVLNTWLETWLADWDLEQTNAVITLSHRGKRPVEPPPSPAHLRDAIRHDLPAIIDVDTAAFSPLWRHDRLDLLHALSSAAMCQVAEWQGTIVGYQISTRHGSNGHLARLAVDPNVQGRGFGRALVSSALAYFDRRGVWEVTVNTQRDNRTSLSLYQRMGFEMTGHHVPVWTIHQL